MMNRLIVALSFFVLMVSCESEANFYEHRFYVTDIRSTTEDGMCRYRSMSKNKTVDDGVFIFEAPCHTFVHGDEVTLCGMTKPVSSPPTSDAEQPIQIINNVGVIEQEVKQ